MPATSPTTQGYAQFQEDRLLSRIFASVQAGTCLEVGAFDGISGSATYAFEQRGWTAILVEPLPEMAERIRACRRGPFFNVAAGAVNGQTGFSRALNDPAISSAATNRWQTELYDLRGEKLETITVVQLTLDAILEKAGVTRIDFATIDVEGHELAVLKGWDLKRWLPRIIIVEDNSRGLDQTVPEHLAAHGYACFNRSGVNDWYAPDFDPLLTIRARLRVAAYRCWRRCRHRIKAIAPTRLKSLSRSLIRAGD